MFACGRARTPPAYQAASPARQGARLADPSLKRQIADSGNAPGAAMARRVHIGVAWTVWAEKPRFPGTGRVWTNWRSGDQLD